MRVKFVNLPAGRQAGHRVLYISRKVKSKGLYLSYGTSPMLYHPGGKKEGALGGWWIFII